MQFVFVLLLAVGVYQLQYRLFEKKWQKDLLVQVSFDKKKVVAGECVDIVEAVENEKWMPLPTLQIKYSLSGICGNEGEHEKETKYTNSIVNKNANSMDKNSEDRGLEDAHIFAVPGNHRYERSISITPQKRGVYQIQNLYVVSCDFFFTRQYVKDYAHDYANREYLYVLPKPFGKMQLQQLGRTLFGEVEQYFALLEDPFLVSGIRQYERESYGAVNWKASAKMNQLMVNSYTKVSGCKIKLLVNLEKNQMQYEEWMQERIISLANDLATDLIKNGCELAFAINGCDYEKHSAVSFDFGTVNSAQLSYALARLNTKEQSSFLDMINQEIAQKKKDVYYVVISAYRKSELIERLQQFSSTQMMMVVPYRTEEMAESAYEISSIPFAKGIEICS